MERLLWRLDGLPLAQSPAFTEGLRVHVQHADLTSIVVQIGGQQHAYLSATACDGCRRGRCVPGCPVALLQRLVRATLGHVAFVTVSALARRPYTHYVLARPTHTSAPLTANDLADWPESRLVQHWRWQRGQLYTAMGLAVGDGPPLDTLLRDHGWTPVRLPARYVRQVITAPRPAILRGMRPWPTPPYLLAAQPIEVTDN